MKKIFKRPERTWLDPVVEGLLLVLLVLSLLLPWSIASPWLLIACVAGLYVAWQCLRRVLRAHASRCQKLHKAKATT
jgi:hypothetical protein